jgi:hypothetical protein
LVQKYLLRNICNNKYLLLQIFVITNICCFWAENFRTNFNAMITTYIFSVILTIFALKIWNLTCINTFFCIKSFLSQSGQYCGRKFKNSKIDSLCSVKYNTNSSRKLQTFNSKSYNYFY